MPKGGGAQNLRRGNRVRVTPRANYRHFLEGLEGTVIAVLHHGAIVALDNDPARHQQVIAPATGRGKDQTQGRTGPEVPQARRQFQFNELELIEP